MLIPLTIATTVSGTTAILASYFNRQKLFYLTKPLSTALILLLVLELVPGSTSPYVFLIAIGLAFALAGDVLLMLPNDQFILGIISFALTHVLYLAAFITASGVAILNPLAVPLVIYAMLTARFLWRGVPSALRTPVLVYVVLITAMAAQAVGAAVESELTALALAAAGALIFLVSDSLLAINRFRVPFRAAQALVLSTYWVAQWLIALSAAQFS